MSEYAELNDKIDMLARALLDKQVPILLAIRDQLTELLDAVRKEPDGELEDVLGDMLHKLDSIDGKVDGIDKKISVETAC